MPSLSPGFVEFKNNYDKLPLLLQVSFTVLAIVFIHFPSIYFLAVAEALAVAPDLFAEEFVIFQPAPGQEVVTVELVQEEVFPLKVKEPFTVTDQIIFPELLLFVFVLRPVFFCVAERKKGSEFS